MEPRVTPELDATVLVEGDQTNPSAQRGASGLLTSPVLGAEMLADRYEILGLLGSGGMGAVYKARDVSLGELIALKVLRPELSDDASMHLRFRQEVKLARRVTHPNVARTFDFGEHGSHKFLTMELIVGASLGTTLHEHGAPSLARVIEVAVAVAQGLGAAHAAGVVHRDLKPDNVLLGDDGRILITDFGIARMRDPVVHEGATTVGAPLGTPAYMAPEQVQGARDIDGRADIYALGAILYELLTGVRAWQGDTVYVIAARRLVEPPPDPREKRPGLAPAFAELVLPDGRGSLGCAARARGAVGASLAPAILPTRSSAGSFALRDQERGGAPLSQRRSSLRRVPRGRADGRPHRRSLDDARPPRVRTRRRDGALEGRRRPEESRRGSAGGGGRRRLDSKERRPASSDSASPLRERWLSALGSALRQEGGGVLRGQ
jgi:serine/threonine-protein kinase